MDTVRSVSEKTGVSVRALRHYDEIGLLKPARVTEAGYRLYDCESLARLRNILVFRELGFPLREIREMLDSPRFDAAEALDRQIALLEAEKAHIENLIDSARKLKREGIKSMDFGVFDKTKQKALRAEAKARFGNTEAWKEFEKKESAQDMDENGKSLMALIAQIAALRPLPPEDERAAGRAGEIQSFISEHFYPCTDEIFLSLADMYTGDERMKENIDRAAGEGAAEYVQKAMRAYVKNKKQAVTK